MISVGDITREQFDEILATYPAFLKSISKPGKKGEETLEDLDKFRYEEAPSKYCRPDPKNPDKRLIIPLAIEDLQKLVVWKLKHGKFRPQLLKLASSNTQVEVTNTSKKAFALYETSPSTPCTIVAAVKKLSELKGIGPATASLLLSIHDRDNVLFFGDEVFLWLCRDGKVAVTADKIKYNFKEYEELLNRGGPLIRRLGKGVRAVDMEKVAFVVMKEEVGNDKATASGNQTVRDGLSDGKERFDRKKKATEEGKEEGKAEGMEDGKGGRHKMGKKRKSVYDLLDVKLRRSKREKTS